MKKPVTADQARELFQLYEQKMYAVAFAILHDEGRAEDAVMDAFEKILKSGLGVNPRSLDAGRFVLAVVKSASIDIYRRQKREYARISYPGDDALTGMANGGEDQQAAIGDDARSLLEALPTPYQDVLKERILEQHNVAETAEILDISESNVRKRQERALKALRKQIGVEEHG